MYLGLEGKVALITGAASQVGFGNAICLLLAKEGCDIVAADIDPIGLQKTASEIEQLGRKALAIQCDITKKAEVAIMVGQALDKFRKIDILVNNAGGYAGKGGSFEKQQEADWDKNYNLNLKGLMLVTQAVFQHMVDRKYGKIINIASDTAKMAFPGVDMYAIAKAGVYVFTRGLAKQLAPSNINVNIVSPGWSLDTNFAKGPKEMKEKMVKYYLAFTPLGRGTTVMDIAAAVAFLASDLSGDITGQVISISGGLTMQ